MVINHYLLITILNKNKNNPLFIWWVKNKVLYLHHINQLTLNKAMNIKLKEIDGTKTFIVNEEQKNKLVDDNLIHYDGRYWIFFNHNYFAIGNILTPNVTAIFVSVWDDGIEIRSKCMYNPQTKNVTDIDSMDIDGRNLDILNEEYVELTDGKHVKNFTIEGEEH